MAHFAGSDASDLNGSTVGQANCVYIVDIDADSLRSTRAYGASTTVKAVRPPQRSGSTAATIISHTGDPNPGRGPLVLPGGTPVPDAALKRDMRDHDTNLRSGLRAHGMRRMMTVGGQPDDSELDMPKMTEREKLADLEARQRKMAEEVMQARSALRDRYAAIVRDLGIEALTEREFRDLLTHAIRVGGAASVGALKALPTPKPA